MASRVAIHIASDVRDLSPTDGVPLEHAHHEAEFTNMVRPVVKQVQTEER